MNNQDLIESFSGIRGIYGQSINERLAYKYAIAYCFLFCNKNSVLVIGGDSRNSTLDLKKAMIKAFCDFGVKKVIDVALLPVQACELAVINFKASGGVYITASHNEPEYNGWKFLKNDGAILYKQQSDKLIKLVHNLKKINLKVSKVKTKILNKNSQAVFEYINYILEKISKKSVLDIKKYGFKILVDPNGGSATAVLEKLFLKLGVSAEIINNSPGIFIRTVEPNIVSMAYLKDKINKDFELGCAFDCDADRVEFILPEGSLFTEQFGQMVSGQYVLALCCDAYLSFKKSQVIVVNDCTSYLVRDIIKKYKAKIKEVEVGETNIVKEMEKQKSVIGGEGSNGGVIIPPIKCRDGIMAMVLILKLIAERQKKLTDILSDYPKYYSLRIKKQCLPEKMKMIKIELEKYFKQKKYKIKTTGGITGGLKILFDENSYLWFRESKTELGQFRIIADSDNLEKVKNMLKIGDEVFDKFVNNN
jgi:phosphomannomutase